MSRLTIVLSIVVAAAFVVVVAGYANSGGNLSEPTATPAKVEEHRNHQGHEQCDAHQGRHQADPTAEIAAYLNDQAHASMGDRGAADGKKVCPVSGQSRATMAQARQAKAKDGGGASCCQGSGPDPCSDGHKPGTPRNPTAGDSDAHQHDG